MTAHVHGPQCGHIYFRGTWRNKPPIRKNWSPEECWLAGHDAAVKSFRRDIRAGGKRSERQKNGPNIKWSDT